MSWRVLVLGVAGGSGSGKSTLVQRLLQSSAGAEICHVCHDSYYHDFDQLPRFPDGAGNWDHPESLDNALFVAQVDRLRQGQSVQRPIYDFATHRRQPVAETVQPRRILLLEGILLLAIPEIRQRLDLSIFVETPRRSQTAPSHASRHPRARPFGGIGAGAVSAIGAADA